nr:P-II family nitrogen regulator [uncultured Holophaga sp.]
MKEVMAVIRMNMVNKTKHALTDAGISSMTAKEALGRGKGLADYFKAVLGPDCFQLLGSREGLQEEVVSLLAKKQRLVPKRVITVVVPDDLVPRTVQTIIQTNQTGKPGDGKIFVLPVFDACRVRTGKYGDAVLDEA